MRRIATLLALIGLGCAAAHPLEGKVWAKAHGAYAGHGEFERAEGSCLRGEATPNVSARSGATRDQVLAFIGCMRERGWFLVKAP